MSCPVIGLTQQLIRRPSLSPDDAGCQALMVAATCHRFYRGRSFGDTQNFWAWRGEAAAGATARAPPTWFRR